MGGEHVAEAAAGSGQDLQHAGGQSRPVGKLPQQDGGEWRLAGRLEHYGISSGQRGRDLPTGDGEGEVPRHNGGDDAHGLAQCEVKSTARHGYGLAAELRHGAGVILEDACPESDFVARVADGLADVAALELGERLQVVANGAGDGEEEVRPFSGRQIAPGIFIDPVRPFNGVGRVAGIRGGDFAEDVFRRRIDLWHRASAATGTGFAIDEESWKEFRRVAHGWTEYQSGDAQAWKIARSLC